MIIRDLFAKSYRDRFPNMLSLDEGIKDLDLRFGFYVKNYPYGLIPTSNIANPGQNIRKFILWGKNKSGSI